MFMIETASRGLPYSVDALHSWTEAANCCKTRVRTSDAPNQPVIANYK